MIQFYTTVMDCFGFVFVYSTSSDIYNEIILPSLFNQIFHSFLSVHFQTECLQYQYVSTDWWIFIFSSCNNTLDFEISDILLHGNNIVGFV